MTKCVHGAWAAKFAAAAIVAVIAAPSFCQDAPQPVPVADAPPIWLRADREQISAYVGKVDQPDVIGGYASTYVLVRTTSPALLPGGALAEAGVLLSQQVAKWNAGVEPALLWTPANSRLAAALKLDCWSKVTLPAGADLSAVVTELRGKPGIELVELDGLGGMHGPGPDVNDPLFASQWHLKNTGQIVQGNAGTPGADLGMPAAWAYTLGDRSVVVAVLDTGVSLSHPDLMGQLLVGYNALNGTTSTDDSTTLSHGTFCAGIIAATANNTQGISGVAPLCRILPVKVVSGSFGSESTVANGLIWAADHGARVANMSLGFPDGTTVFRDAVTYAAGLGVVMVASTGNTPGALVGYPARWSKVIAVGATDNMDRAASFETTGSEMDLCAPGVGILTTVDMSGGLYNTYAQQSGTSMSAPMVSATAALIKTIEPSLSAAQVLKAMQISAVDLGDPGPDSVFGTGRLDTRGALAAAITIAQPCISDWDHNGQTDPEDLFDFLGDWFTGTADVNHDGVCDTDDLFVYLDTWFFGCV